MIDEDFDAAFNANTTDVAPTIEPHVSEPETTAPVEEMAPAEVANEAPDDVEAEHDGKKSKEVPLATFLDMRDRMKDREKEAEDLRRQIEAFQTAQSAPTYEPDPNLDPHGFANKFRSDIEQQILLSRMQMSKEFALQANEPAVVEAAIVWAKSQAEVDPNFDAAISKHANPISWAIQQHAATTAREEMLRDPDAWAIRRAAELSQSAAQTPATYAATTQQATKKRPTSLTDVPASTSKVTPQSDKDSFDSLFNNR